ncbi:RNA-directed DNA polymerase, eukaryota [Tanacetum coccineum]
MGMGPESGAGDADYVQRAMIHYEIDTGLPFNTGFEGGSKRHKSTGSSSFNRESGEASINLNTNVDDNDKDEVQEIQRPEVKDKARAAARKNKWSKSSASSSVNEDALARLMVTQMGAQEKEERLAFLEIKRREVKCRERELEQQDMRFYLQSYDYLVGDQRKTMDEIRAKIKTKCVRLGGIEQESPQKGQVTMVTSMPPPLSHARLGCIVVNHSPPVSGNEAVESVAHEGISSLGTIENVHKNMSPGGSKRDHVDSLAPSPKPINGFSILERFQEFISIGQAMGFGMNEAHNRRVLQDYLLEIDSRLDKGEGLPDDLPNLAKTFFDIDIIDRKISIDMTHKAKVKWAIERDKNSKFFHVGEDVSNAVKEFFNSSIFSNGCNPSFIAFIPKILDGPLILNEIVYWCKTRNEQALLFKVDFQKAFNSVRWDHLDDILGKFGLGSKCRGGLRQGDPLSPFLFILVMESLHVAFQRVIDRGMFVPILVGKNDLVPISHLFYANDAMFIGKWSSSNVNVLMMMLHCLDDSFGRLTNNLPFTYLGVIVAANIWRINSWNEVIQKFTIKLSKWKDKSLSVGGLWLSVIKAINGSNGLLNQPPPTCTCCAIWITIHKAAASLKSKGVDLSGFYKKVIGNGNNSNFWYDKWLGHVYFKVKFNRMFNLDLQKDDSVAQKF